MLGDRRPQKHNVRLRIQKKCRETLEVNVDRVSLPLLAVTPQVWPKGRSGTHLEVLKLIRCPALASSLAFSGPLWLTRSFSGSLWLAEAHSGSHRLAQAHSGSFRLTRSLTHSRTHSKKSDWGLALGSCLEVALSGFSKPPRNGFPSRDQVGR